MVSPLASVPCKRTLPAEWHGGQDLPSSSWNLVVPLRNPTPPAPAKPAPWGSTCRNNARASSRSGRPNAIQATAHAPRPPPELEFIFSTPPCHGGFVPTKLSPSCSIRLRQRDQASVGSAHSFRRGHLVDIVTILTRRQGVNHDTRFVTSDIAHDAFVIACKPLAKLKKVRLSQALPECGWRPTRLRFSHMARRHQTA